MQHLWIHRPYEKNSNLFSLSIQYKQCRFSLEQPLPCKYNMLMKAKTDRHAT